uniref:Immunoglobulin V-set domain-containing protein n=1 Tax=Aquila chrysaetos chrysaetos TaxID=223781 RepID=A0A663DM62_AQUCH
MSVGTSLLSCTTLLVHTSSHAPVHSQEPSAETTEGTSISINCSHPNKQFTEYIYWYRQLPGRGPAFLVSTLKDSKKLTDPPGRLSVAADRRSSALWLARPRRGDAAAFLGSSLSLCAHASCHGKPVLESKELVLERRSCGGS